MPVWGEDRWRQDCDGSRPQRADRLLIRPASGRQAGTGLFARTDPHQDTRERSHCINESRAKSTGTTLTTAPDGTPTHSQFVNSAMIALQANRAGRASGFWHARRAGNARSRSRSNAHRPRPSKRRHALEPQTGDRREQTDQTTAAGRGLKLWLQVKAFPAPCRSSEERDR